MGRGAVMSPNKETLKVLVPGVSLGGSMLMRPAICLSEGKCINSHSAGQSEGGLFNWFPV